MRASGGSSQGVELVRASEWVVATSVGTEMSFSNLTQAVHGDKTQGLEFFSGVEFFRTCARSGRDLKALQRINSRFGQAKGCSMGKGHVPWARARWKVAKRCKQRGRQS